MRSAGAVVSGAYSLFYTVGWYNTGRRRRVGGVLLAQTVPAGCYNLGLAGTVVLGAFCWRSQFRWGVMICGWPAPSCRGRTAGADGSGGVL